MKKLIVFILSFSILLSSFTVSIHADEINNEHIGISNSNCGINSDIPIPKKPKA